MEIFTKDSYKEYLKKNIQDKTNAEFARIAGELETEAEIRMKNPLYSVTFSESRAKSGDPHDYYSEAPYWWPDPNNPGGRFIRRDGEFYPDRMINHMLDMKAMVDDVYIPQLRHTFLTEQTLQSVPTSFFAHGFLMKKQK